EPSRAPRKANVAPDRFGDGPPPMRADRHPNGKTGRPTWGRDPPPPGIDRAVTGNVGTLRSVETACAEARFGDKQQGSRHGDEEPFMRVHGNGLRTPGTGKEVAQFG